MSSILGRWDLTVGQGSLIYPSWVEFTATGGQFVGRFGSARPLASVSIVENEVQFRLPKQYEGRNDDLIFHGCFEDGKLVGTTTYDDGGEAMWVGVAAPLLPSVDLPFASEVDLISAGPEAWGPRDPNWQYHWSFVDGALVNSAVGTDIVSVAKFGDFELEAEYRYPEKSNSGIYLRGRYEFQILDDYADRPNTVGSSGAIYGFLTPAHNAVLPPNEWNSVNITLRGRWVTVVLNGSTIHDEVEIPGITGGALDSHEGEPGSLFLQGDHGPITFRKLVVRTV